MNTERLLRDTLREWADAAPPPVGADLAGQALVRRRRRRVTGMTVTAAAFALLAGGVAVPVLAESEQPGYSGPGRMMTGDVSAYPGESPPRHLIAAGDIAVSAYQADRRTRKQDGMERTTYTWYLYSPRTQQYEKTRWGWLDVAPGMKQAAVLEKTLPASRVGILDLDTGKVTKWIPLEHKAGGVKWSPDGKRLAVTTYSGYPDVEAKDLSRKLSRSQPRTGYYLVDVDSGRKEYRPMGVDMDHGYIGVGRMDVRWSRDGTLLKVPTPPGGAMETWYDLEGRPSEKAPPYEGPDAPPAGLSPDGRYYTVGDGWTATVKETATHRAVNPSRIGMALAWADGDRLVRWECPPDRHCTHDMGERLVLTDPTGRTRTPLTGYRYSDSPQDWEPLITRR